MARIKGLSKHEENSWRGKPQLHPEVIILSLLFLFSLKNLLSPYDGRISLVPVKEEPLQRARRYVQVVPSLPPPGFLSLPSARASRIKMI